MDVQICSFSDEGLTTEVDPDKDNPSIFFRDGSSYFRQFAKPEQLEKLRDQINDALAKLNAGETKNCQEN